MAMAVDAQSLISEYVLGMDAGPTLRAVLDAAADPSRSPADLAQLLSRNPGYAGLFTSIELLRAREGGISHLMGLLGKQAARNAIATLRLQRRIGKGIPTKPKDKLVFDPKQRIKYASTLENYCEDHRMPYGARAWSAGFVFDWIALGMEMRGQANARPVLDAAFAQALVIAKVSYQIGTRLKNFPRDEMAFAGPMLLGAAEAILGLAFPKAASPSREKFLADCDAYGPRKLQVRSLREKETFPITQAALASWIASQHEHLAAAAPGLLHWEEPRILKADQGKTEKENGYVLALVYHLAVHVALGAEPDPAAFIWARYDLGIPEAQLKPFLASAATLAKGKG